MDNLKHLIDNINTLSYTVTIPSVNGGFRVNVDRGFTPNGQSHVSITIHHMGHYINSNDIQVYEEMIVALKEAKRQELERIDYSDIKTYNFAFGQDNKRGSS